MRYNWELLAYYIRKPCKLCKLSPDAQELIHKLIQQRKTLREVAGALAQLGIRTTPRQVWTHRKHLRTLIEKSQLTESSSESAKLKVAKLQLEQLRLARTREELANATLAAMRELTSPELYERIVKLLQEEDHAQTD